MVHTYALGELKKGKNSSSNSYSAYDDNSNNSKHSLNTHSVPVCYVLSLFHCHNNIESVLLLSSHSTNKCSGHRDALPGPPWKEGLYSLSVESAVSREPPAVSLLFNAMHILACLNRWLIQAIPANKGQLCWTTYVPDFPLGLAEALSQFSVSFCLILIPPLPLSASIDF